jgi:D-alanine-D-alanine ligase
VTHPPHPAIALAILHQAVPPPDHDGIVKAPKPGGYRDSGADIAYALRRAGVTMLTPDLSPNPARDEGWTFPDTEVGIATALEAGATVLWANTVLFSGHPIEPYLSRVRVVGQHPATVQRYDDKSVTNRELLDLGLPVAPHLIVAHASTTNGVVSLDALDDKLLRNEGMALPLVVKPIRGRGSAGVTVVNDLDHLRTTIANTIASHQFGSSLMIEPYLPGEEVTVTVMPPDPASGLDGHWCLPPVRRFNHDCGIVPYNGTIAVVHNSEVLPEPTRSAPAILDLLDACRRVAQHIGARAPIRIDCRQNAAGLHRIFDVNLKPNMTGPGRPGRDDQLSLTGMAAAAIGMSYTDLLMTMLGAAWVERAL